MKFFLALFGIPLLPVFLVLSSPVQAQTCYELVWSDEFSYEGLPDTANWSYEVGASGWGNNELQYYTRDRMENARVEEGNLIIEARKESYLGANYTSARLITYPKGHSFRYGKVEASIKLPFGQGIWPAFWMLGDGIFEGTPWPSCGEIDIMEMVGGGEGKDDVVHGTIHWSDANGNHADYGGSIQLNEGIFADTFHVFSVEWNSTSIKWFLDGVQYHVVDITPSHMSEFQKDFFILLNLAVGGNWPGNPNSGTLFPQKMFIDYVRIYQSGETPEITGPALVNPGESGLRFSTVESGDLSYTWSVPDDAKITMGQGTHAVAVDWGCDTGSVSCEVTGLCGSYSLVHRADLKNAEMTGKDRIEAFSADLTYSVPPTGNASYQWTIPEGVVLNSTADSNSVNVDWNDEDGEIFVVFSNVCGTDSAGMTVTPIRQLPYPDPAKPHAIPGTISPVEYDSGGEGISYHDTEAENLGPGSRQDEGVDTEVNDQGETIGWLEAGEWTEYTVKVENTDLYNLDIRLASNNALGKFRVLFNGEDRTGEISAPNTGDWSTFTTRSLSKIQLNKTDSLMRLEIINGLFNIGRLTFSLAPTGADNTFFDPEQVYLYPTFPGQRLFVQNLRSEIQYSIVDMTGRLIDSGMLNPDAYIAVGKLRPGAYLLILKKDRTRLYTGRFFK